MSHWSEDNVRFPHSAFCVEWQYRYFYLKLPEVFNIRKSLALPRVPTPKPFVCQMLTWRFPPFPISVSNYKIKQSVLNDFWHGFKFVNTLLVWSANTKMSRSNLLTKTTRGGKATHESFCVQSWLSSLLSAQGKMSVSPHTLEYKDTTQSSLKIQVIKQRAQFRIYSDITTTTAEIWGQRLEIWLCGSLASRALPGYVSTVLVRK